MKRLYRKKLPSRERLVELFSYEPLTGNLIWKHRTNVHYIINNRFAGKIAGGLTSKGYLSVLIDGDRFQAHRVIWKILHDTEPPDVDHKDRNKANNRKKNLRATDRSGNRANCIRAYHKILPKGVFCRRQSGALYVQIKAKGKQYYLGNVPTAEAGAALYAREAKKLHGEFWRQG